jgi:hypothetical protein
MQKEVVVSKMEIATRRGAIEDKAQMSQVRHHSLNAIISVNRPVRAKLRGALGSHSPWLPLGR